MLKQKSFLSIILVLFQLVFITILILTGDIFIFDIIYIILIFIASFPSFWAIYHMKDKLRIRPEPTRDAKLITYGPYKYIRHPMYATVISVTLIWVFYSFSFLRLAIYILLVINMVVKMFYEENILKNFFEGYKEYSTRTKRIIPLIF